MARPILWMKGTGPRMPLPWRGREVAGANELLTGDERAEEEEGVELRIASLAEHVRSAPTEGLPAWTGELRSGARANLLMGVASNQIGRASCRERVCQYV